jgi:cytochrome c-type biogenesis protein CcsB
MPQKGALRTMTDTSILSGVTFVYLFSTLFYVLRMLRGREFWGRAATVLSLAGLAAQTLALALRWKESHLLGIGHAPLSNFYESLIFFAWAIVLLYLIVEWRTRSRSLGAFILPVAFFAMAYASFSPDVNSRIQPLIPALQSNWLVSHVVTCFLGYACFTVAFGFSVMHLLKERLNGTKGDQGRNIFAAFIPSFENLDELIYQSVVLGFILLSLGIITGSVWAHYAWGSYWSWDPKETWSLITWLIYALMLHARLVRGWRGRRTAVIAVIGFASMLFTYLGVNYLPGLHSYLK